ncbi:MIOREX complex component 8 [[Candida] railenensis]|uniref:MIOREX complex component 8 n=1 Tax=[Candida] railenensis TaxID=45579 RepID=A0A9P0W0V9_9ASCO|nr:MIOREX complex component 8 [[Candida] railenensis]
MFPSIVVKQVNKSAKTSLNYLLSALPTSSSKPSTEYVPKHLATPSGESKSVPSADPASLIITPNTLNKLFHDENWGTFKGGQISRSQQFFNNSQIKLDWTLDNISDIPDIKYERLKKDRDEQFAKMDPYNKTSTYYQTASKSKKTFGIPPDLLKPLPEVLLLGNTNVGKSTIVNTLLLDKAESQTAGASTEYAYVSRRAGYTKTLNCFNINNKIRIVDSPGYGQFGERIQGQAVMDYIEHRKLLRNVFVLIDGLNGVSELDAQMIGFLMNQGVSFDIIFTKVDQVIKAKLPKGLSTFTRGDIAKFSVQDRKDNASKIEEANEKVIKHFSEVINDAGLKEVPTLPRFYFNNGVPTPFLPKRYGYKEIRCAILQSCGLI